MPLCDAHHATLRESGRIDGEPWGARFLPLCPLPLPPQCGSAIAPEAASRAAVPSSPPAPTVGPDRPPFVHTLTGRRRVPGDPLSFHPCGDVRRTRTVGRVQGQQLTSL